MFPESTPFLYIKRIRSTYIVDRLECFSNFTDDQYAIQFKPPISNPYSLKLILSRHKWWPQLSPSIANFSYNLEVVSTSYRCTQLKIIHSNYVLMYGIFSYPKWWKLWGVSWAYWMITSPSFYSDTVREKIYVQCRNLWELSYRNARDCWIIIIRTVKFRTASQISLDPRGWN